MEQNKSLRLIKHDKKGIESQTPSYPGIRSLFREPLNLYHPNSESSGVFTKRYDLRKYKSLYR
jgi:hypothetical protein